MTISKNKITADRIIIYIHGKGGNSLEAAHYEQFFKGSDVVGLDYKAQSPWEAKAEFPKLFAAVAQEYQSIEIIANSIGAFFAMNVLVDERIEKAYFISPIVNMQKLILNMMAWAGATERELRNKKEIQTNFGEMLSWKYLCYVRENPIIWTVPTHILYGENDNLTSYDTIVDFASKIKATLTVMKSGEHWFHTKEQMEFLDNWLMRLV